MNLFRLHPEDAFGWLPLRDNGVGNGERPDGRRKSTGGPARGVEGRQVGGVVVFGARVGGVGELGGGTVTV